MGINSYRDLTVWQKSIDVAVEAYRLAALLPPIEGYGLAAQIRRAATSVSANIAEGHGRTHIGDFSRSVSVARGSLMELDSHLVLCERLGYLSGEQLVKVRELIDTVSGMLTMLKRALRRTAVT